MKCSDCGCDIDESDMGDCDTCNIEGLCGDCVTKHHKKGHNATLRTPIDILAQKCANNEITFTQALKTYRQTLTNYEARMKKIFYGDIK